MFISFIKKGILFASAINTTTASNGPFTQAISVAEKLHQVSNMFETPAILQRQIALKITPGLHCAILKLHV